MTSIATLYAAGVLGRAAAWWGIGLILAWLLEDSSGYILFEDGTRMVSG